MCACTVTVVSTNAHKTVKFIKITRKFYCYCSLVFGLPLAALWSCVWLFDMPWKPLTYMASCSYTTEYKSAWVYVIARFMSESVSTIAAPFPPLCRIHFVINIKHVSSCCFGYVKLSLHFNALCGQQFIYSCAHTEATRVLLHLVGITHAVGHSVGQSVTHLEAGLVMTMMVASD